MSDVTVLGAGIAGISACYHAKQRGLNALCFEADSKPGGLVSNFSVDGFRFDNAIHLSFTSNEYVKSLFLKTPYLVHKPDAYCLDRTYWMKHPVQNNLFPLPAEEKIRYIKSFIERPSQEPQDYAQWLDHQFGNALAEKYPKSYTRKYWGLEAEKLSMTWIGNRVRRAEIDEILSGAMEKKNENHYYAKEMRYPKKGGYFEFIREITEQCDIELNCPVVGIDPVSKTVRLRGGKTAEYIHLVNTLPLPKLIPMIDGCPQNVIEAAESLLWTTVDLISVGFNRPDVPPYLWFYLYGEDSLASRGYSPSWKSSANAPEGKSSLQFEIYNLSSKAQLDPDLLKKDIKAKLLSMGVCKEEEILFLHHKHLPFGNVVFDHGMEQRRQIVLDYLDSFNIKSSGRFGAWEYFWSDQSFLSGKEAVETL